MEHNAPDLEQVLGILRNIYEQLPFNQLLGLRVTFLRPDAAGFDFPMQDRLVGNFVHGILHGGVISSVLDATGGLTATAAAAERLRTMSMEEAGKAVARIGTIDMRVDYLRPGRGTHFYATGSIMRTGKKVAVTRMELKNQDDVLIAVGTGAYLVG